jgi:hypothetical protein
VRVGRLVLAVLVLAGLVAFAAWELRREQAEGAWEPAELVFPYSTRGVERLTLRLPQEERHATFARTAEGEWEVVEGTDGADPTFVADVLSAWSRVRFVDELKENPTPEDLELYELAPPRVSVEAVIRDPAGAAPERPPRLDVGGPLPLVPGFYARIDGTERVVAVGPDALDLELGAGREALGLENEVPETE